MKDSEFKKLNEDVAIINERIGNGLAFSDTLEEINNNIAYLNIQIAYQERESPTDGLSEYYQKIELCWLFYKLRDFYFDETTSD